MIVSRAQLIRHVCAREITTSDKNYNPSPQGIKSGNARPDQRAAPRTLAATPTASAKTAAGETAVANEDDSGQRRGAHTDTETETSLEDGAGLQQKWQRKLDAAAAAGPAALAGLQVRLE
jgi:hypothetical protein